MAVLPLVAVLEVPAAAGPPVNLHVVEVMPLGAVLEVSGPPVGLHVVAVLPLGTIIICHRRHLDNAARREIV